jgi:hypothetical protein
MIPATALRLKKQVVKTKICATYCLFLKFGCAYGFGRAKITLADTQKLEILGLK